ncbi:hypothetical protein [Nocardia vaccinii]|nr:hypothetical protein [Nocardia vaccinii]
MSTTIIARQREETMWQEIVRLAAAWGGVLSITVFWYWVMKNIGTF